MLEVLVDHRLERDIAQRKVWVLKTTKRALTVARPHALSKWMVCVSAAARTATARVMMAWKKSMMKRKVGR